MYVEWWITRFFFFKFKSVNWFCPQLRNNHFFSIELVEKASLKAGFCLNLMIWINFAWNERYLEIWNIIMWLMSFFSVPLFLFFSLHWMIKSTKFMKYHADKHKKYPFMMVSSVLGLFISIYKLQFINIKNRRGEKKPRWKWMVQNEESDNFKLHTF